ncbi:glycosyltransferase [Streptomyces sp. NPDC050433]|uniref:glycosyltransferase n=1 Tax=Streptomyces sp. NPDC050433 TaxID=3365615 RepID=UPI0037A04A83
MNERSTSTAPAQPQAQPETHASAGHARPKVSVLMPTYRQAWGIRRAIGSLRRQEFQDWELIVIDDGSPDSTGEIVSRYADEGGEEADPRISYHRLSRNRGLGHALEYGTSRARGDYLCYLPSDDVYFPGHLRQLVEALDTRPSVYLAYGGVHTNHRWQTWRGATLAGDGAAGREAAALEGHTAGDPGGPHGHNVLALVQVMHRRELEREVRWPLRSEIVSDTIEAGHWRGLLAHGAEFAWTGSYTCEWVDHPDQRHKIIGETHTDRHVNPWSCLNSGRGMSAYRTYYGVPADEPLNWRPARGIVKDERASPAPAAPRGPAGAAEGSGLRILIVGTLGFNADRVRALHEQGHELHGLWLQNPDVWDTTVTAPVRNVRYSENRAELAAEIRRVQPDVIYALLNYHAISLIHEVATMGLDVPLFFHFKESPFHCLKNGLWPKLIDIFKRSHGHIFISEENREWFTENTPEAVAGKPYIILDGDLPRAHWMTDEWAEPRRHGDGEIHTVCVGRPEGIDDFGKLIEQKVHVHLYGDFFRAEYPWVARHGSSGYLHLHHTVYAPDWVPELSQYDAAWTHNLPPRNGGDIRAASWPDLNLPSRLGTYAAAGLPLLLPAAGKARTSLHSVTRALGTGIEFEDLSDVGRILQDQDLLAAATGNMRGVRRTLSFDAHAERLAEFFRR